MIVALALAFSTIELVEFAAPHWRTQPETRIEDAYKWLFHATLGGEHAVTDDAGPRRWMDREWSGLGKPYPKESEVTPLRPDGKIIRVNLRPYKARGGDREMLLAVFVESARLFSASKREFVKEWNNLGGFLEDGPIGHVTRKEWLRLDKQMKPLGYPAIHHSEAYEKAYRPAYRVILNRLWL